MSKNRVEPTRNPSESSHKSYKLIKSNNDPFFTHSTSSSIERKGDNRKPDKNNHRPTDTRPQHADGVVRQRKPKHDPGKRAEKYGKTPGDGNGKTDNGLKRTEKTFDKKKWRLQKYSKKYKLDQWEEKRKKAVLREYYQEFKDEPKLDVKKIYEDMSDDDDDKRKTNTPVVKPRNYVQHPNYVPPEEGPRIPSDSEIVAESSVVPNKVSKTKIKNHAHRKVQAEFERIKQEKEARRGEYLQRKTEKEEAIKLYKQKKNEKYKRLNKKTKRGQPIMKDRIEMLLEKIQSG